MLRPIGDSSGVRKTDKDHGACDLSENSSPLHLPSISPPSPWRIWTLVSQYKQTAASRTLIDAPIRLTGSISIHGGSSNNAGHPHCCGALKWISGANTVTSLHCSALAATLTTQRRSQGVHIAVLLGSSTSAGFAAQVPSEAVKQRVSRARRKKAFYFHYFDTFLCLTRLSIQPTRSQNKDTITHWTGLEKRERVSVSDVLPARPYSGSRASGSHGGDSSV